MIFSARCVGGRLHGWRCQPAFFDGSIAAAHHADLLVCDRRNPSQVGTARNTAPQILSSKAGPDTVPEFSGNDQRITGISAAVANPA